MSESLAHYSFLPWMRRGIGTLIAEGDALGSAPSDPMSKERADMEVSLTLESADITDGSTDQNTIPKTFKFIGPPDVLAISDKAIVRVEPKSKVNNFESNGLPYIEFYEEDFLWAYTPAGAQSEKLTPWLALVCLKSDEFALANTSEGRSYITITEDAISNAFHPEDQHWAWAHVHLNTELVATNINDQIEEVTGELEADPDSGVCRLLCPRKLIKETEYTAFLVPAFETGRLAGLGLDYTNVYAQKMSWGVSEDYSTKTRGYDYPVYYSWKFRTGLYGDFESLARLLTPVVTGPELGKRDMYIAEAGYGLDSTPPDSTVLGIEGALKPPDFVSDPWTNGTNDVAYRDHLRKLLNLSIDHENKQTDDLSVAADSLAVNPFYSPGLGVDPIVTPEIYGRWHALATRLQTSSSSNHEWVNDLNLDPRNRATAGLGTSVIKKNQEDYMRRAWKQVEQVNEANKKIRRAALARMVNHAIYSKHVLPSETDQMIRLTSAVHSFVRNGSETVHQTITGSIVPNATQSAAFKKIIRPGKKSNRIINSMVSSGNLLHQAVTQSFNDEVIRTAPDKTAPALTIGQSLVATAISSARTAFETSDEAMASQALFEVLLEESDFSNLNQAARKTALKNKIDANADINANSKTLAKNLIDGITSSTQGSTEEPHQIRCSETPFKALFGNEVTAKTYGNIIVDRSTGGAPGLLSRATSLSDIDAFETAFNSFATYYSTDSLGVPKNPKLSTGAIDTLKGSIRQKLDQKTQMISRVASAITLKIYNSATRTYVKQNLDKLRPIMAHPKFEDPMFRELKSISQEYILPNIDKVPENSITLLETNQAFIEAYMAGLNHEMSRELLWREYPTDQRGTYFRQFWDISDNVLESDEEKKLDIKKMNEWMGSLGDHSPRAMTNTGGTYLVLLIRGELLKKYPNTQVYAQKAQFKDPSAPDAPRELADASVEGNILVPVFMAELDPDIYLFGFDLDTDEARGDSDDASKPGWFFVLRERPGQIRFGLDDWTPLDNTQPSFPTGDPDNWNDLSWEHFVNTASDLDEYQLDATHTFNADAGSENTPRATWGKNAADIAYILYQNPVMFARHAQEMLPDENSEVIT